MMVHRVLYVHCILHAAGRHIPMLGDILSYTCCVPSYFPGTTTVLTEGAVVGYFSL